MRVYKLCICQECEFYLVAKLSFSEAIVVETLFPSQQDRVAQAKVSFLLCGVVKPEFHNEEANGGDKQGCLLHGKCCELM